MWAVRKGNAVGGQVAAEGLEAVDLEGEVGKVGLDLDGTAVGEIAQFDGFLAFRSLQEDEFRAAGRLVASDFVQAEDFAIEPDGPFEVVHPVTGMEQSECEPHGPRVSVGEARRQGHDEVGG